MRFKLTFDKTIPVDDIPDDIIVHADTINEGFYLLADELATVDSNDYCPIKDVLCNSQSVLDEFNDYLFDNN